MNFDWLVSISTALFASITGVGLEEAKNPIPAPKSREIIEKVIEDKSKIATEADLVRFLGGIYKGEFVPREDLLAMSKNKLTKNFLVKELLDLVEQKLPENFSYPPLKEAIKFRDISEDSEILEAAQKLKSLEIFPENDGFFGKVNDKNPEVSIGEMNKFIKKAFDSEGNLNYLKDKDLDGIPNALDACPDLPAPDGCPKIESEDLLPGKTIIKVSPDIWVHEETEIQLGDEFSSIIFDPKTREIFSQSGPVTVTK